MAVNQRKVEALLNAQAASGRALLTRMRSLLRPALARLGRDGWYAPKVYVPVAQQFADMSLTAQKARAAMTSRFTQAVLHELGEDVKAPISDVTDLRGVDPLEVWSRPMEEYRYQVSTGKPSAEALGLAVKRAEAISDANLQLADRQASRDVMAASKRTVGYRRVIHPELSAGGSCGLCIAASTRKYHVKELRAIHENCGCTNVPITAGDDLGHVLNTYDLAKLYGDNAGSTDSQKLKYTRYQVNEHGELGPVIRRKGDHFKDAKAAADATGKPAAKTRDQAVAELQDLLRQTPANPAAIKAKRQEISRLNRVA